MDLPDPDTVGRVLDDLGVGHARLDRDWRITHLNASAARLTATTPGALVGQDHWAAFPAMRGTVFEEHYRRAVTTGETAVFRARHPAPLHVWVEVRAVPREGALDVFFTDVTSAVQAEQEAERAGVQAQLVAAINADLLSASSVEDVVAGLAPLLVPALADGAMITLLDPSGAREDVSLAHRDPTALAALVEYVRLRPNAIPAASPLGRVLATGRPVRSSTAQVAATVQPGPVQDCLLQLGDTWSLHLPVQARNGVLGALTLLFSADRRPDASIELAAGEIAGRIATALDNAALVMARTQLAEALQRSLLTDPPQPDHGQIVARYHPAAEAAQVGGDWYDAFLQPSGTTMLVIGDVVGHDTAAAATMGQVRGLLRGIAAYSDAGPVEVLRGLDASMELLLVHGLATALVVRLEQTPAERTAGTTRMVWASAGHPPPLVLHADGRIEVPGPTQGDLLLGVEPTAVRAEHTTVLGRGATVVLYTDGLVERRGEDLDQGTRRLVDLAGGLHAQGADLDDLADGLLEGLTGAGAEDDVAVIAIRLHRQDLPRPPEAGPQRIPDSVPPHPLTRPPRAGPTERTDAHPAFRTP